MTLTDKNRIFFALIHYILVEQKNVDWILKTSLIDFTGISSLLEERAYKTDNILDSVVDFITNIKPYHVQFSHYFEHYQTHQELANVRPKDWIEPKIHMRFDALKPISDINLIFNKTIYTTLPETKEYNVVGMIVYLYNENKFYVRKNDDNNDYFWEEVEEPIYDDGFYYEIETNKFYKGNNGALEEFDGKELADTHRANRLFYLGIHDNEEIKKTLNANFKGIEVYGSNFDIGKFGYDIFDYDTNDYDSPTIVYDYYFLNKLSRDLVIRNESDVIVKTITGAKTELSRYFNLSPSIDNYQTEWKGFFDTTKPRFKIPFNKETIAHDNVKVDNCKLFVYELSNGAIKRYDNFESLISSTTNPSIDLFKTQQDKDKFFILVCDANATDPLNNHDTVYLAYVAECTIYQPSTSSSLKRTIVEIVDDTEEYALSTPSSLDENGKIAIQKVSSKGTRVPILNPSITNNSYIANLLYVNEYEHISMVSFDFKYLYDKIYTWEDRYGRSNNVVYLSGDKFYRPRYEDGRPSELVALSPLNSLFVYNDNEKMMTMYFNDFKNTQKTTSSLSSSYSTITSVYSDDDRVIKIIGLSDTKGFNDAPGKVIINSEIITYNKIDRQNNKISELKRACNGSFLYFDGTSEYSGANGTHKVGDKVYPLREDEWAEIERKNVYKTYTVRNPNIKIYDCPSGYTKSSTVKIKKLPIAHLLEDVYLKNTEIIIDTPNVVDSDSVEKLLQGQTVHGDFVLKINDDEVPFETIYPDSASTGYCISNYTLPEKYVGYGSDIIYSAENSIISTSITQFIDNFIIQIVESDTVYNTQVVDDDLYILTENKDKIYKVPECKIETVIENGVEKKIVTSLGKMINIFTTARNNVSNEFYQDEVYFGNIDKEGYVYKSDGTMYGKFELDENTHEYKLTIVKTQVILDDELNTHDSLLINVHNFKYQTQNYEW